MIGSPYGNYIAGNDSNDYLDGGDGNSTLVGGSGNDLLVGSAGNNLLVAGTGSNILVGGSGGSSFFGGTGNNLFIGGVLTWSDLSTLPSTTDRDAIIDEVMGAWTADLATGRPNGQLDGATGAINPLPSNLQLIPGTTLFEADGQVQAIARSRPERGVSQSNDGRRLGSD